MRDIFFIGFFVLILAISFRKPFVAVALWLWSGIYVPVYWLYSFAESIRYNLIFSLTAIASYIIFIKKKTFEFDFLSFLVLLFFLHTTLTTYTTIANPDVTWKVWEDFMKIILLFLFVTLTLRKKVHFELIIWVAVLSIGFFGFIEGLKFIKSGGTHQIHGPYGHLLGDNNHLALALLMVIPLTVYLLSETKEKWLRIGLIAVICICVLAVLGTKSRGGFLGLLVVGGYFWFKSKNKIFVTLAFVALTYIAANVLHESWFIRMETIETVEEDSSFLNRIAAWKINTLMAMERPALGGGFKAAQYGYIWRSLALNYHLLDFIETPAPGPKAWAAHSIYFQVLGDHGFVGLGIFLSVIAMAFLQLSSIEKYFKDKWQAKLSRMIKVSLVAFCATGAAVSMAYFEFFYVLLALITCINLIIKREKEAAKQNKAQIEKLSY